MTENTIKRRFLRAVIEAFLTDDTTAADLEAAAALLRNKAFLDRIESLFLELSQEPRTRARSATKQSDYARAKGTSPPANPRQLFDLIKRRKLTKADLLRVMRTVRSEAVPAYLADATVREIVETFFATADRDDVALLAKIVSGEFEADPFLEGMRSR
jgi:hypothetical protein